MHGPRAATVNGGSTEHPKLQTRTDRAAAHQKVRLPILFMTLPVAGGVTRVRLPIALARRRGAAVCAGILQPEGERGNVVAFPHGDRSIVNMNTAPYTHTEVRAAQGRLLYQLAAQAHAKLRSTLSTYCQHALRVIINISKPVDDGANERDNEAADKDPASDDGDN
jgi:hypothetical protein